MELKINAFVISIPIPIPVPITIPMPIIQYSRTHYVMGSDFSDYGPDLTVSCTKCTEKSKKESSNLESLFCEDFKTINMTKIAIEWISVYKWVSQIIVMK